MIATEQAKRREERLRALMNEHRCWPFAHPNGPKFRDYDDSYAEFAIEYLGVDVNASGAEVPVDDGQVTPIPRYAAITGDETYSMIALHDTVAKAIEAESGGVGDEYLMNPAGVYDLDAGERIETVTVGMSTEAYTVLCGLVHPNWLQPLLSPMNAERPGAPAEAVNHAGIYTGAWDELRASFPLEHFRKVAQERGEDFYCEEAGL